MSTSPISIPFDDLLVTLDKLEPNGSNWIAFKDRFLAAAGLMDIDDQFDGTSTKPSSPEPTTSPQAEAVEDTQSEVDTGAYNTALAAWQKKEKLARHLLSSVLPDSLFLRYMRKPTVAETWSALEGEFTCKSMMIKARLHSEFMSMRYENGADLRAEFDRVRTKHWELLNYGIEISQQGYLFVIINFIPYSLSDFLAQMFALIKARSLSRGSTWQEATKAESDIEPETLMEILTEEWERRRADKERRGKERRP